MGSNQEGEEIIDYIKLYPEIPPPPTNIYPELHPNDPKLSASSPISMEQCIVDLIKSETELLAKLTEICVILRKRHKNCAISKTASSSASIVGSVLTISGVLLAPFTAGLSLTATAAGNWITTNSARKNCELFFTWVHGVRNEKNIII